MVDSFFFRMESLLGNEHTHYKDLTWIVTIGVGRLVILGEMSQS